MKHMATMLFILMTDASAYAQNWGMDRAGGVWNKVEMCHGCHDMAMRGGMGMGMHMGPGETAPKLGGQHAAYLEKSLRAYRSGERRHPVMNRMASMLSDREIIEIAAFYAKKEDK